MCREFEDHRRHLRAVAYRTVGSLSEAEDAGQDAWLRLSRTDTRGAGCGPVRCLAELDFIDVSVANDGTA